MVIENYVIAKMITSAINRHGKIEPCRNADGSKKSWLECFDFCPEIKCMMLYYNHPTTGSTHIITVKINQENN